MATNNDQNLGRILKQRRVVMSSLTLHEMGAMLGVSSSHLSLIESGKRFPSALILRKMAEPLGFEESELLSLAGYLSPQLASTDEEKADYGTGRLDLYVRKVLSQEPVEVQCTILGILAILKSIAKLMK